MAAEALAGYRTLMRQRVEEILLVASPYDSFILEEDGQFAERLFTQYVRLNLSGSPHFSQAPTGEAALERMRRNRYDLVITTPHCADMSPIELAKAVKEMQPGVPVVMLTYDRQTAQTYADMGPASGFVEVFLWSGDPRLLLVLVKSVEDRLNVARDTRKGSVRVILLIEDSPTFYSSYLPIIYTELLDQTKSLMPDVLNEADRLYRMRARPKILMARTFDGAKALLETYRDYLLGVICDMRFWRGGQLDPTAGLHMIELLRAGMPDLPILLQSAEPDHQKVAAELGVAYADKNSPDLLASLRRFMVEDLGFGPFIFRTPDGQQVDKAPDLQALCRAIGTIPEESLRYHVERNHISAWLMTRCEFDLARTFQPWKVDDYESVGQMRQHLVKALAEFLNLRQRGQVTDYVRGASTLRRDFTRLGTGSMGGKARGIAFVSHQLADHPIHAKYPGVRIFVPRTKVICTDVFDEFVERDNLGERALQANCDDEVARLFLGQPLEQELIADLEAILREVQYPLAVRSSSLFEDSAFEPLAGLYHTIIVPNCSASASVRLEQLSRAIRLVFASTFYSGSRSFMQAGSIRMEEEKMAVVIMRLVGSRHHDRFYPDFAGVAQSHNFYPIRYLKAEDGVATVALGLGQTVVDGGKALRFCPRYPEVVPQMSSTELALRYSQRQFYALDLSDPEMRIDPGAHGATTQLYDLALAQRDGTLEAVGATYSANDDRIHDTIYREGVRLVNFAGVLKYDKFPLAAILSDLLELCTAGLGIAAEMEFAVALSGVKDKPELGVVQLRPLVCQSLNEELDIDELGADEVKLISGPALGSGVIDGICDVVYVHPDRFDPKRTREMAAEIGKINARLLAEGRAFLLMAPGRWGTADPFLGIPVSWPDVCGARAVVELAVPGFRIAPSQGTHFFHNITSLRVAYFTIDLTLGDDLVDLAWFESHPACHEAAGVRHIQFAEPLQLRIDPRSGAGVAVHGGLSARRRADHSSTGRIPRASL